MVTKDTRERLRKLAEATPPGPWERRGWNIDGPAPAHPQHHGRTVFVVKPGPVTTDDEMTPLSHYVAACDPETVLALLDEIDRLSAALAENPHVDCDQQVVGLRKEIDRLARRVEVGEEAVVVLRKFLPPRAWWTQRTAKALAAFDQEAAK